MIGLFYLFIRLSWKATNSGTKIVSKLYNYIPIFYLLHLTYIVFKYLNHYLNVSYLKYLIPSLVMRILTNYYPSQNGWSH